MTQFFISFSVGCILIGSLYIICPNGNISNSIKYIFSLIFLVIIISAANIPLKKIELPKSQTAYAESSVADMQISAAEYIYTYTLTANKINFSKISFNTDNLDDGSIVITKVIISSQEPKEKIVTALGVLAEYREVEITNE